MSEYGFGYYSGDPDDLNDQQAQQQAPPQPSSEEQSPKWFRDYMKKSQAELQELRSKLAAKEVAEQFQAKGFDPAAATLYQGDPAKVDEWLTAHGGLLAKRPGAEEREPEQQTQQQGPPASTVSSDHQEQLQRMQAAGNGQAPSQGTEADVSAALNATRTIEEFEQVARANGWPYNADGLFG